MKKYNLNFVKNVTIIDSRLAKIDSLEHQFTYRLSLYPHSHLFDPDDFEQPYSEEPELTSRDFIYQSWSDSMDSAIDNAMQTESQDTGPVEFNWDEFFDSVINPTAALHDHEVIFSNEKSFFSL